MDCLFHLMLYPNTAPVSPGGCHAAEQHARQTAGYSTVGTPRGASQ